ncbi:hypothetical protein CEXT_245451 [Caerostris extrusa]|uniref:Uncharacterized protein n=1 Tax=Caerostris extrusa TaxID=172846 RepID=A0AAV4YCH5_CAEEX|nr:hypothetical protein CEXT_245451 [Caerostris extrusa]
MTLRSLTGRVLFRAPNDESLQSAEHICKRMQQMANEKAADEKVLSLYLTYLNDSDIEVDPVVHQKMENIVT